MSAPMVRALLAGNKTQTRRVIRPQPVWSEEVKSTQVAGPFAWPIGSLGQQCGCPIFIDGHKDGHFKIRNPHGGPGDHLWVRETWYPMQDIKACALADEPVEIAYKADWDAEGITREEAKDAGIDRWRPSIFMPRWASRITLEITGVRVERLQSITTEDCIAEGIDWDHFDYPPATAHYRFANLWDSLNAKHRFGWDTNPWVFVLEFSLWRVKR